MSSALAPATSIYSEPWERCATQDKVSAVVSMRFIGGILGLPALNCLGTIRKHGLEEVCHKGGV